jgi:hypothetical protein
VDFDIITDQLLIIFLQPADTGQREWEYDETV